MKKLFTQFHALNPSITVQHTSVPWAQAQNKWLTLGASHSLPDVISIDDTSFAQLASAGYITSLQSYYQKWNEVKALSPSAKNSNDKYNGQIYAIPEGFGTQALFIRTDWMQQWKDSLQALS